MNDADLPHLVIGACMNVHRAIGPGLSRDEYLECVAIELRELEFDFKRQVQLEFDYRGKSVKSATKLDFIVNGALLLQVCAQETVSKLEEQRFESLFKISKLRAGLLVNFNVMVLRKGIHQILLKRRDAF